MTVSSQKNESEPRDNVQVPETSPPAGVEPVETSNPTSATAIDLLSEAEREPVDPEKTIEILVESTSASDRQKFRQRLERLKAAAGLYVKRKKAKAEAVRYDGLGEEERDVHQRLALATLDLKTPKEGPKLETGTTLTKLTPDKNPLHALMQGQLLNAHAWRDREIAQATSKKGNKP